MAKFDRKNNAWAAKKLADEKKRKPDRSYPVVTTPHGLFAVTVVDLEENRFHWRIFVPAEPVILAVMGAIALIRHHGNRDNPKPLRYEAQVVTLKFPGERRVTGKAFPTFREAKKMQEEYERRLRSGWKPTEELGQALEYPRIRERD